MIRPRGGTTRRRDDEEEDTASSAEEIGRLLRDTREGRGLDLLVVHDRLGRPITEVEALENGNMAGLPDQAMALSTLRRYAFFLGLDGDALALRMIDAWSALPAAAKPAPPANPDPGSSGMPTVVTAVTGGPDHLRAFTQTGEVPKVGGGSSGPPTGSGAYGYGVATGPPTGTFPVVPRQDLKQSRKAVAKARRRLRAPALLKAMTWVAAGLVAVVIAGLAIYVSKPTWLAQAHILKVSQHGGTTASGSSGSSAGGTSGHAKAVVVAGATAGGSASYTVSASHFAVALTTSDRCWVQVTSSASSVPLIEGVQPAGKIVSFPANGTMTVEVGNTAVVVAVVVNRRTVFLDTPHTTPFTYTFAPAS